MEALHARYSRGIASLEDGNIAEALNDLSAVAAAVPSWEASMAVAFAQHRLGREAEASASIEQAIARAVELAAQAPDRAANVFEAVCSSVQSLLPHASASARVAVAHVCSSDATEPASVIALEPAASGASMTVAATPLPVVRAHCSASSAAGKRCLSAMRDVQRPSPQSRPREQSHETQITTAHGDAASGDAAGGNAAGRNTGGVCVCGSAHRGSNAELHDWARLQLCSGAAHVWLDDRRRLSPAEGNVSRQTTGHFETSHHLN